MNEEDNWILDEPRYVPKGTRLWKDKLGRVRKGYYINLGATLYFDELGRCHRMNGPAIYYDDNKKTSQWFYYGKEIYCQSQKEFEKHLKMKAFW